jgi:hypothetical protein
MSWVCLMQNKEVIAVARQQDSLPGTGEIQYCLVWFGCQVSLADREYIMTVSPQHLYQQMRLGILINEQA